jgi:hypothetical protein
MDSRARRSISRSTVAVWVLALLAVMVTLTYCGYLLLHIIEFEPIYYAEARSITKLASAIPGVEVIEVDGWHDLTLVHLYLVVRYQGTEMCFTSVSEESFGEGSRGVSLAWIDAWHLCHYGFDDENDEETGHFSLFCNSVGLNSCRDLARLDGEVPSIRSIPDFFAHFEEAMNLIGRIPESYPGLRVVKEDGKVNHYRRELRFRTVADDCR